MWSYNNLNHILSSGRFYFKTQYIFILLAQQLQSIIHFLFIFNYIHIVIFHIFIFSYCLKCLNSIPSSHILVAIDQSWGIANSHHFLILYLWYHQFIAKMNPNSFIKFGSGSSFYPAARNHSQYSAETTPNYLAFSSLSTLTDDEIQIVFQSVPEVKLNFLPTYPIPVIVTHWEPLHSRSRTPVLLLLVHDSDFGTADC